MANKFLTVWSEIPIRQNGKYLGFYIGPGGDELTWNGVCNKMLATSAKWASVGAGGLLSILACNIYIFSKMSYILQCAKLPPNIYQTMLKITAKLFKGPGMWITPDFLNDMTSIGCSHELINPHAYSLAITARVILKAGFDIQEMITEYLIAGRRWETLRAGECGMFDNWFANSFGHNLSSANRFARQAEIVIYTYIYI